MSPSHFDRRRFLVLGDTTVQTWAYDGSCRDASCESPKAMVLPGETVVVEFEADNPGQWMAHCHNTYHLEQGMAMIMSYVQ